MSRSSKERLAAPTEHGFAGLVSMAEAVLEAVSQALAILIKMTPTERASPNAIRILSRLFFDPLRAAQRRNTGLDSHLIRGIYGYGQKDLAPRFYKRPKDYDRPRLADLVLMHFNEATSQSEDGSFTLIPSPLHIAIEALTIPEDIQTRAYALLAGRTILSRRFSVWPAVAFSGEVPEGAVLLDESKINEEIRNIRTFADHRDNRSAKQKIVKKYVSHFVAAKGIFYLRLPTNQATNFLENGIFSSRWNANNKEIVPEFRLSHRYREIPEAAVFINEMLGLPLPIRGAETIFFNGLRPSANNGLVISVSGGPGTGKTSFTLALAAALAPLDTHTLYLTLEENPADLRTKLAAQGQPRLHKLSFHYKGNLDWFMPVALRDIDLGGLEGEYLPAIQQAFEKVHRARKQALDAHKIVTPLPLLVIIDSISALPLDETGPRKDHSSADSDYLSDSTLRQRLVRFVEVCRNLNALVVLVTSDKFSGSLEYLVDVVTALSIENENDHTKKPLRLFALSKSRHQMARHGTHVFHLSGESGFRFAPQLPSQIDAQIALQHMLWDDKNHVEVLNVRSGKKYEHHDFLRLHVRSHVLVHGRGSSGKAGLALKIAFAPTFYANKARDNPKYLNERMTPRVLILSFLYPGYYYDKLRRLIQKSFYNEWEALAEFGFGRDEARQYVDKIPSNLDVIHFAPGFLSAEDLYSRLVRQLEKGRLEGRPYSVVVIDGLHNLALQFPGARDTDVLWPIVYGTLSRANVSTITTFTTLELKEGSGGSTADHREEGLFRLRSHLPLMHALVQASDYVIEISRAHEGDLYETRIQSAISREPPREPIFWDRQKLEFVADRSDSAPKPN